MTRFARRLARRYLKAKEGSAAIEFAVVALPFFLLLFGLAELGLIFAVSTTLENGLAEAARTIRTGAYANSGTPQAFKAQICSKTGWLQGCESKLGVEAKTFAQFNTIDLEALTDPVKGGAYDPSKLTIVPGGPEDIVLVRAYYPWKIVTPLMGESMARTKDGKALITATVTFRNEPYE